jgi:hypothetical protein
MDDEVERWARVAVERQEAGCDLVQVVDYLISEHPGLREAPFRLATVLRTAFGLSIPDMHAVAAWVRGESSREELEAWLRRES